MFVQIVYIITVNALLITESGGPCGPQDCSVCYPQKPNKMICFACWSRPVSRGYCDASAIADRVGAKYRGVTKYRPSSLVPPLSEGAQCNPCALGPFAQSPISECAYKAG